MGKHKPKTSFKAGDAFPIYVDELLHVRESDPCNKDNCMLSRAFGDQLVKTYGGKPSDYKIKSTNHGVTFVMKGRKYVCVFDTKTAQKIYTYDKTFRATRSKEKARSGVRSFTARVMVEASSAVPVFPAMTAEVKKHLRNLPRKKPDAIYVPKSTGVGRELSL